MAFKLDLNVCYPTGNKKYDIVCSREKILEEIKKKFNLERKPFVMYQYVSGDWVKVTPATMLTNSDVRIRLQEEPESVIGIDDVGACKKLAFHEVLKTKLHKNQTLTGNDRKYIVEMLEQGSDIILKEATGQSSHEETPAKKRRLSDDDHSDSSTETIRNASPGLLRRNGEQSAKKLLTTSSTQTDPEKTKIIDMTELKKELKKLASAPRTKKNQEDIKKLMNFTFEERRGHILTAGPPVRHIREMYPILFDKTELLEEFGRIRKCDVTGLFYQNLSVYSTTIIRLAKSGPLRHSVKENVRCAESDEQKKYVKFAGALLLLPTLVDQDIGELVSFDSEQPKTNIPIILCDSCMEDVLETEPTFKVYAEKIFLDKTTDFIEAVLILVAAYYCFDMEYPNCILNATKLLEILLLDFKMEEDVPKRVEKMYKRILTEKNSNK